MNTPKKPKRHHFIPVSYQRLFWNESTEKIHFLDKSTGTIAATNPKNFCVEKHLYTADIEFNPTEIENPLLSGLDGKFANLLTDNQRFEKVAPDRITISLYVAFLRYRTPSFMNSLSEHASKMAREKLYTEINKSTSLIFRTKEIGIDIEDYLSFEESIKELKISMNKSGILAGFLSHAINYAFDLALENWKILISENADFVTSDKPFSCVDSEYELNGEVLLKRTFLIPLSARACLELGDCDEPLKYENISSDKTLEINEAIGYCAEKWVLGSSEEQLLSIYKRLNYLDSVTAL